MDSEIKIEGDIPPSVKKALKILVDRGGNFTEDEAAELILELATDKEKAVFEHLGRALDEEAKEAEASEKQPWPN